jgi:transcriptional regulator with XRE-family HTH domain
MLKKDEAMGDILTSEELGAKLRGFRKSKGFTQEQLAERTGVSFQQIQLYESGKTRMNTDKLQALALAMSIPVAAFFGEIGAPLSADEKKLLTAFRSLSNPEVRAFVVNCLVK